MEQEQIDRFPEIQQAFKEYRKESDPSIAISDEQAAWILEFIKTII